MNIKSTLENQSLKLFTWHVYHINCDCASYDHAWQREVQSGKWRRCIFCHKQLGDMELSYIGKCRAVSESFALELMT